MSGLGQKQTFAAQKGMSVLPPKADMCGATRDVRFGPIADNAPFIRSPRRRRRAHCGRFPLKLETTNTIYGACVKNLTQTDYSVVVKLRGNPPKAWKWEIYRAGRWGPLESSPVFFENMAMAGKEGKKALARLLAKAKHAA